MTTKIGTVEHNNVLLRHGVNPYLIMKTKNDVLENNPHLSNLTNELKDVAKINNATGTVLGQTLEKTIYHILGSISNKFKTPEDSLMPCKTFLIGYKVLNDFGEKIGAYDCVPTAQYLSVMSNPNEKWNTIKILNTLNESKNDTLITSVTNLGGHLHSLNVDNRPEKLDLLAYQTSLLK